MARLVPQPESTAVSIAGLLRRHSGGTRGPGAPFRASAVRRMLEELGVRCDESDGLYDLKGFLLSSARGTEIVVNRSLSDEERLAVYAHLVAHALLGPEYPDLGLGARFEYAAGREPDGRTSSEEQEERVAEAVAQAILAGRLEAAPRLVYCRDLGVARGRLKRAVLLGIHYGSLALYLRSARYQRLRSLPVVAALTERVHSLLASVA